MERWTLAERQAGRFRLHINFGGPGFWCMFDYVASADAHVEGVEVVVADAGDDETARWFPHLKQGMVTGWRRLQEDYGRFLTGVRVEVTKVYTHPVATTAHGCEYYGGQFIDMLGRYHAVRVTLSELDPGA